MTTETVTSGWLIVAISLLVLIGVGAYRLFERLTTDLANTQVALFNKSAECRDLAGENRELRLTVGKVSGHPVFRPDIEAAIDASLLLGVVTADAQDRLLNVIPMQRRGGDAS